MIILGIDPGSLNSGYAVIDVNGRNMKYIASGVLVFAKKVELINRLGMIYESAEDLIRQYNPEEIALESLIYVKSIPMKYGLKTTKTIVALILSIQILILNIVYPIYELKIGQWTYYILLIALSLNLLIMILMLKNDFFVKYSQSLLKLSMLIGLSALFV